MVIYLFVYKPNKSNRAISSTTYIKDLPYDQQTEVFHQIEIALYNIDSYDFKTLRYLMSRRLCDLRHIMDTVDISGETIDV